MNYKKHIKTFSHFSYKNGSTRGLLIAFTEGFEQWMSNASPLSFLKQSPTQIYKLDCLPKVCTGLNILASYRLSRKSEVYNQNKKPVRRPNREKQQDLNKGEKWRLWLLPTAQDDNISGRCCHVRISVTPSCFTWARQQITSKPDCQYIQWPYSLI